MEELEEALEKVKALLPSLPENQSSYALYNSGSSYINTNTGNGPQNSNNSSSNQFNGPR